MLRNFEDVSYGTQYNRIKQFSLKLHDIFNIESINLKASKVEMTELQLNINDQLYQVTFDEKKSSSSTNSINY